MTGGWRGAAGPLGLLLLAHVPLPAQSMDDAARWVDTNVAGAHALLEEVVDINSGTSNHAGVRAVGDIFLERLAELGFDTEWVEVQPDVDRAGHALATLRTRANTGRSLLLIGHLDTVFEPGRDGGPDRFVRDGTVARGPGVADDKGGIVVLLYALAALHAADLLEGDITVLLTGDEESVGRPIDLARAPMVEAAERSDVVLSFERGFRVDGQSYATVARRGSSRWVLTVQARQAHSGRIFTEADGAGAANELARILHRFYGELAGEEFLTFNVGTLLAGTEVEYDAATQEGTASGRTNIIPGRAIAHGDLRAISPEQLERTRAAMRVIVADHLPHASAEITFEDGYPPMSPRDVNYELLDAYSEASQSLGLGPVLPLDPGLGGAGDIAFASELAGAALDGLGPEGGDTHGPEEWVDLASFVPQIKRAAALIHRLTSGR